MKYHVLFILIMFTSVFTSIIHATDMTCEVTLIDDGQSQYPIASTHRYKNTTEDGKRAVYFRANQPNPELFRQQQIYSFPVDNPSQVTQISHDLEDGEYIADYRLLPDNQHLLYQVVSPPDTPDYESRTYIARFDKFETHHIITIPSLNSGWQWHPKFYFDSKTDNNWVIFHDSTYNLHVYDINSQQLLKLSDDYTFNYEISPTEPIVYYSDDQHQIYVARLDDTTVTSTGNIGHINWISEDGNWLLISPPYEIDDPYQIYALNTNFSSEPRLIYESNEFYSDRQFDFVSTNEVVITIMDIDEQIFKRDLLNLTDGSSTVYNAPLPTENIPNALWQYTSDGKILIFGSKQGLQIFAVNEVIEPPHNSSSAYNFILDESENFIVYFEENESNVFTLISYNIRTHTTTVLYHYDEFRDSPSYVYHSLYFAKNGYIYYEINGNFFRIKADGNHAPRLIGEFNRPIHVNEAQQFIYFARLDNTILTVNIDDDLQYHEVDEGHVLLLYPQSAKDIFYYMKDDNLYASTFTGMTFPLLSNINSYSQAHLLYHDFGQSLLTFSNPIGEDFTQVNHINCGNANSNLLRSSIP